MEHCDNTGSEVGRQEIYIYIFFCLKIFALSMLQVCLRKGTARAYDHAQLVHAQWLHVARLNMSVYIKRVATNDNIADLPSREV